MRLKYVLTEVMTGLWRNVTMTVAMIITMTVSLGLLGASVLMFMQVQSMRVYFYDKVEVSIFLKNEVTKEQRDALDADLKSDPLVKEAHWESKDEAYNRFREQFKAAPELVNATTKDALPESFRVKLNDPNKFTDIYTKYKDKEGIDSIVDQKSLLEKIFAILGSVQKLSLVIAVIQGAAALLLVANTIQVAAYSKRREVSIMKLVGSSNWYIQLPFVLEAVFAGLIGAIVAYAGLVLGKIFLIDGALKPFASLLTPVPWSNVNLMLPLLAGVATVISAVTGWVTLRFYLKK